MTATFVDVSDYEKDQFKEMLFLKKQKMLQNLESKLSYSKVG